jgi:hypothetical protein
VILVPLATQYNQLLTLTQTHSVDAAFDERHTHDREIIMDPASFEEFIETMPEHI